MNFRQVRKKIKTISNVKKITKAMQMVSAVKMRRSIDEALDGKLYRTTLDGMLRQVLAKTGSDITSSIPMMKENTAKKNLYLVISANKGLCGNFNATILKHFVSNCDFNSSEFIVSGRKGAELIRRLGGTIIADFSENDENQDTVSSMFLLMKEKFLEEEYKTVSIVYNNFISSMRYEPTIEKLLPILNTDALLLKDEAESGVEYLIEPNSEYILPILVEDVVKEKIRTAVLESNASEHSARMMAMKLATDSAGDIIGGLTMLSNKLRQQSITYELLDIISAQIGSN